MFLTAENWRDLTQNGIYCLLFSLKQLSLVLKIFLARNKKVPILKSKKQLNHFICWLVLSLFFLLTILESSSLFFIVTVNIFVSNLFVIYFSAWIQVDKVDKAASPLVRVTSYSNIQRSFSSKDSLEEAQWSVAHCVGFNHMLWHLQLLFILYVFWSFGAGAPFALLGIWQWRCLFKD